MGMSAHALDREERRSAALAAAVAVNEGEGEAAAGCC